MIYFIRHGETDFNIEKRIQGQLDIELNENGINQAEECAKKIKDFKFDVIYSSPLKRAKITAEIINKHHNVPIIFDDRLMEFNAGPMQGKEFKSFSKEIQEEFLNFPERFGAEKNMDFLNRVSEFFKTIENEQKNILIVGHGGTYRCIYMYKNKLTNADFGEVTPKNCEIIEIK